MGTRRTTTRTRGAPSRPSTRSWSARTERTANVGYLGGDLKGILNNADYLWDLGFTAVWLTPLMDNPDEHFSGGEPIEFGGAFKDGGKTGYHGYWINNFFVEDEHLVSEGLDFEHYARKMKEKGFKIVFDIVANHTAPAFTMPQKQPKFGELYDADWNLVADHENLAPAELDADNPLHAFFHREEDILQLSNINDENPAVLDYFVEAYLSWIDKGADAFRIDTIRHVPHRFWRQFVDRIHEKYPDFFMFGESYVFDANFIAQHTLPKNGGISVLDFPGRAAMEKVFGTEDAGFEELASYLHLTHGPYNNPYDLITFYDNHDMTRLAADEAGFIDAHNWLFTSRGIPCVYYGSELAFMTGTAEHAGNRNYFGQDRIEAAKSHPIHHALREIANLRKALPALQQGLQLNVKLEGNEAVFYRVLQHEDIAQIVLVMLNKGDAPAKMACDQWVQSGDWRNAVTGEIQTVYSGEPLATEVPAHGFALWVLDAPVRHSALIAELDTLMRYQ
jgi:glycosidase